MIRKRVFTLAALALLLAATPFAASTLWAQAAAPEAAKSVAASLQPFVDSHTLAGAVVLVASKDKVLCLEAVGCADIAARKPMPT